MKILVLNGSPKGDYSITLQTSIYLSKIYTDHQFDFLNAGQRIKALEKDFSEAQEKIIKAQKTQSVWIVFLFL